MSDYTFFSTLQETYPLLLQGMWVTLQITFCAIIVGIIWGTLLAIMRLYMPKPFAIFAATYVNIFRSVPLIMVLFWFYLVIGPGLQNMLGLGNSSINFSLFLAMLAFSLFEAAYYSEIIRAGIKSVKSGQNNAALALGMSKIQTLWHIILPQAFRNMVPLLLTQGIILFQDTTLVYVISLTDFFRATDIIGYNNGYKTEFIIFAAIVYFTICFSVSWSIKTIYTRKKA